MASTQRSALTRPRGVSILTPSGAGPVPSVIALTRVSSNSFAPAPTAASRRPRTYLPGSRIPPFSSR